MSWSPDLLRIGGLPLLAALFSFFSSLDGAGAAGSAPANLLAIAPPHELPEAWLPSAEKLALAAMLAEDDTVVVREEDSGRSVMGTVAKNTAYGAVAGALVGGALYLLDDDDDDAIEIAYWAAGGALVGVAVGVVQALIDEGQESAAVSRRGGFAHPAPTVMVPLLRLGT